MSGSADHDPSVARAIRLERNWATVCIVIIAALILVTAYAGIHQATMPQTVVETVDPTRLHLSGEFTEANLGSELRPDGTVLVVSHGGPLRAMLAGLAVEHGPIGNCAVFRASY